MEELNRELAELTSKILQSLTSRSPDDSLTDTDTIETSTDTEGRLISALDKALEKIDADLAQANGKMRDKRLRMHKRKIQEWRDRYTYLRDVAAASHTSNPLTTATTTTTPNTTATSGGEALIKTGGGAPIATIENPIAECQFCFDEFSKTNERVACCPALQAPCGAHNSTCKQCMKTYLETEINGGYMGKCPQIYCPETKHEMPYSKRVVMSYSDWSKMLSEPILSKYKTFAESYLLFLCSSCHTSRSQLVPYDEAGITKHKFDVKSFLIEKYSSLGGSHAMVDTAFFCPRCDMHGPSAESGPQKCSQCNLCTVCCGKQPGCERAPLKEKKGDTTRKDVNPTPVPDLDVFAQSFALFNLGQISAAEFYDDLFKTHAPKLQKERDSRAAWSLIKHILSMIGNPERKSAFQVYYWNRHPKFDTLCCNRTHCFRCKTRDFHEGQTCDYFMSKMDSSVLPCPTCFVFLAKGDGCDSVTCVCGYKFSWTAELAKYREITAFANAFPNDTPTFCAEILCGAKHHVKVEAEWAATQSNAAKWRRHNQSKVDKAILVAWRKIYPLNADRVMAKTMINETLADRLSIHACVRDIWNTIYKSKVDQALKDLKTCSDAMLNGLYPTALDKLNALSYFANDSKSRGKWTVETHKTKELNANVDWLDRDGNIMFHFNPRSQEGQIVMNTMERGTWGREERIALPADFMKYLTNANEPAKSLKATVVVTSDGYEVYLGDNKSSAHLYRHRIPFAKFAKVSDSPAGWSVRDLLYSSQSQSKLSFDELNIFENLKAFKKSNKEQCDRLVKQVKCKAALSFLQLHGNDKVTTSYKLTPLDGMPSMAFNTPKTSWDAGDRVILTGDYAEHSDAGISILHEVSF